MKNGIRTIIFSSIVRERAQNFTELALVIGIVGIVLMGMQVYVKRGISAKVRDLTDAMIGAEQSAYSVDVAGLEINEADSGISLISRTTESTAIGGVTSVVGQEISTRSSSSTSLDTP